MSPKLEKKSKYDNFLTNLAFSARDQTGAIHISFKKIFKQLSTTPQNKKLKKGLNLATIVLIVVLVLCTESQRKNKPKSQNTTHN
jgi:hypothetical protein